MTYADLVELLNISVDRPAREDRFEAFRRAVAFHGVALPSGEGVVLVGGTNGKGTVSVTLATLLATTGGGPVGLFTSPHLVEPTERISIDGRDLTRGEMVRAFEVIEPTVRQFELSHFEILTLMMIEVFFGSRIREPVRWAVIEVGVGGRLDPTRVVPHETAVLARIGLDHEAMLGSTLEAIAREKLPIAEGARRLVYMKPARELEGVFADARSRLAGCEFIEARTFASRVSQRDEGFASGATAAPEWTIETPWGSAPLVLMGDRAVQNTSLALEVLQALGADVAKLLPKLRDVRWPGRMERVSYRGRELYLSGDHNEQGVESLREILTHFTYETLWLVVGIGKGKPLEAMLSQYRKIPRAKLVLTRTYFRALDPAELARQNADAKFEDAVEALEFAIREAGPRDLIVVSGSLYLVGDLKARIARQTSEK